jgi:hypothetical protein
LTEEQYMIVEREDLVAAASVGVLQYKQVEPVLVFLLQRDVSQQRKQMLAQKGPPRIRARYVLFYLTALFALATAAMLVGWYTHLAFKALGVGGLLWFTALYATFTIAMAAWFERRKMATAVRIFTTSVIALMPLAVFASQHLFS